MAVRRSATSARSTAATSASTSACAISARASSASRRSPCPHNGAYPAPHVTIVPIPSGTRDVLPDEMRELRAIGDAMRAVFEEHGYGEVATPALEYDDVLARGGAAG